MRSLLTIAGWVLALLLLVLLVARTAQLDIRAESSKKDDDSLTARSADAMRRHDEAANLRALLKEAQSEVAHLKARLHEAESGDSGVHTLSDAGGEAPMVEERAPKEEAHAAEPDFGAALLDTLKSDRSGETAERFARSAVQMHYGEFLQGLALAPEIVEEVRAIMVEVMKDMSIHGVRGPGDASTERLSEREYEQLMQDELSELLSREDLQLLDEYQATLEERSLRRTYEFQMNLYGQGLSEENRGPVIDMLVEGRLAILEGQRESARAATPEERSDALLELNDHARERLWGTMDEEQYAIFQRFIGQLENQDEFIRGARESVSESQ